MVRLLLGSVLVVPLLLAYGCAGGGKTPPAGASGEVITLPAPSLDGDFSLEKALALRRSVREFPATSLGLSEVGQILWAAQGITDETGKRTAPSAGALYPLEVYLVAGNVEGITAGVYRYVPGNHALVKMRAGDLRTSLAQAALGQGSVRMGAVDIVIAAVYERTTVKYGERGIRYVHMEAGHAAQNVLLEVTALGLAAVPVGAFEDDKVKEVLGLPDNEAPLYIIPVGRTT
ncbi:MAG: SagB/ThcOx family dehydrogenase [Dehalococcoidales bacterium]|nr:SagB/ThcOx family dehydrogenase [Dehalococcoidales bacterium]